MIRNPFCLGPITQREQFFGRQKEVRSTLSLLNQMQCVSVIGPKGIGKTSFLNYLAHPFTRSTCGLAEEHVFVLLDGRRLAGRQPGECFLHMREEAIRQIKSTPSLSPDVGKRLEQQTRAIGGGTEFFGLRTLCSAAGGEGVKLVLALDHFDPLAYSMQEEFFNSLRSLASSYPVAYIVLSLVAMHELEQALYPGSPFFNIFHTVQLGSLASEESRELVVTVMGRAGVHFSEPVIELIIELGQNLPHQLQRAGYVSFELWREKGGSLCEDDCDEIRRRFQQFR